MSVGFTWPRDFTKNTVVDERRMLDVEIKDVDGKIFFEQNRVEVPASWSDRAATIVASQYFRNINGVRECSVYQVVERVVDTIVQWGEDEGYFLSTKDAENFRDELAHILLTQRAAFNSPIWYNFGVPGANQQGSACFIGDVEDDMESITDRVKIEARIFKWGSGFGCNNSRLRASTEGLSYGGTSSGPVSFMLLYDAAAEVVRSAGMRRAAKDEALDVDHPDILSFIRCKGEQEALGKIAKDLLGTDGINNTSVRHQNANHSVMVSDQFMQQVENDDLWSLIARNSDKGSDTDPRMIDGKIGDVVERVMAKDILQEIAQQAWACGDPGIKYADTINAMNTVPSWGRIVSSNPCSEFLQPPWSACNLASLNLERFFIKNNDGRIEFQYDDFVQTIRTLIVAMDIIALCADYPDDRIAANSRRYRPLGLGYTNLGAMLVRLGMPYDSIAGRSVAACITSLMSAIAWHTSSIINEELVRTDEFPRGDLLNVIGKHCKSALKLSENGVLGLSSVDVKKAWILASKAIAAHGASNSQVTLLAPTGTISFLMDAETTGIEPMVMLGGVKKFADGGQISFELPRCVCEYAEDFLGYVPEVIDDGNGVLSFDPGYDDEARLRNTEVLSTAMGGMGMDTITYQGHIKMMAAVQPFLSGAISKTVNLPNDVTIEEIKQLYIDAWKMGLKSIAVYRDGSKFEQVYNIESTKDQPKQPIEHHKVNGLRVKLPDERDGKIHKFHIGQHKGYITTGLYPDGKPGEIFIVMNKQGSTVRGLLDTIATLVSMCLQYGVPLDDLVNKFKGVKFEPQGITKNQDILFAQSPVDYIFRYLENRFIDVDEPSDDDDIEVVEISDTGDGDPCSQCGTIMKRRGTCMYCDNCDITTGCS